MPINKNIINIQTAFQEAKQVALNYKTESELTEHLNNVNGDYIGVSFEGASMGLAIRSYKETLSFMLWEDFKRKNSPRFSSQIHVGLGWAFAELDLELSKLTRDFIPKDFWRVVDGYGYNCGLFNRRKYVRERKIPKEISGWLLGPYFQGLGRSLWYISRGDVLRLKRIILLFNPAFHSDLWRGVGIAITYVGKLEEKNVKTLLSEPESTVSSLRHGAALALFSRKLANNTYAGSTQISSLILHDSSKSIHIIESSENKPCASIEEYSTLVHQTTSIFAP